MSGKTYHEKGDCVFTEREPFYCKTHDNGVDAEGRIHATRPSAPCASGKAPARQNTPLLLKRLALAQARFDRWLPKLTHACNEVSAARAEINRLRSKLEKAGVHVDETALDDVTLAKED